MKQDKKLRNFIKTTIREFLNESVAEHKNNIIKFVKDNSYFEFEGEENGVLHFATRKNGSVSNETASMIDIKAGRKLIKEINNKFSNIEAKLEVVDEFVLIFISDIKEDVKEYRYTFIKDINNQGFSKSFDSMESLIKKYGDWVNVNWDEIINKIDSISDDDIMRYNEPTFTGWYRSRRIMIKSSKDEDNKWGYNFYVMKSIKVG